MQFGCLTKCSVIYGGNLDLSDFNKKEIQQIDAYKRELIDLCIQQQELYNNISKVFEQIKGMNFSEKIQDPCKKCLVQPACTEECIYKQKQIAISEIKEKIKEPTFVKESTAQLFGRVLPIHEKNPSKIPYKHSFWKSCIFPQEWELE